MPLQRMVTLVTGAQPRTAAVEPHKVYIVWDHILNNPYLADNIVFEYYDDYIAAHPRWRTRVLYGVEYVHCRHMTIIGDD